MLAYSSQAKASAGLNQLREQAESTGETVILAAGMTWIVRPAEGTAVGKDMLKAAKAIGGKKKILP
ncbi:MAG: glycine cleavage system aminomethyltransferase T [Actinomycetes bacterium]